MYPNGHWLLSKVLLVKSEFYKQFGFQEQKIGKHENASKMFEEQKRLTEKALENIYNSTVDIEEIQLGLNFQNELEEVWRIIT